MAAQKSQPDLRPDSESKPRHPDALARPDRASTADGIHQAPDESPAPFAAAVYPAKKGDRQGLARFVESLKESNVRVGGILQEKVSLGNGGMAQVEAINIATGQRTSINKPRSEISGSRDCSLDVSALAATTAILRTAIEDRVDLIVVEKFGDEEREGKGLTDEILQGIAAGIPLLIAVPESNLDVWTECSGGMGDVLPFDETAFLGWWGSVQGERAQRRPSLSP